MTSNFELVQDGGDLLSLGVLIGALVQWLPSVAALFTLVWTLIRIYESNTFGRITGRKPNE